MTEPLTIAHILAMRKQILDMRPTLWYAITPYAQLDDNKFVYLPETNLTPQTVVVKDEDQLARLRQAMPHVNLRDLKEWEPEPPKFEPPQLMWKDML